MQAGSLQSTREAYGAASSNSSFLRNNSFTTWQTQLELEETVLSLLCRVYQVIVIYPKAMTKRLRKKRLKLFRDQSFIQGIENLLMRILKRPNFSHVPDHVVYQAC